jgi:hypothetical protein
LDAAEQYGPAASNYISLNVSQWLQPRLQATENAGSSGTRLITAIANRSKNQGRWYFADGWILTFTNEANGEFTFQRYITEDDVPLAIRAICSGYDSSGRERIFASFRGQKEGYVFELDSGRSFDGDPIPAFITLNPISLHDLSEKERHDRMFVYGTGYGVANLTMSRATNYALPDTDTSTAFVMGATDSLVTTLPKPFRGSVQVGIEGYDVTYRFDSNTATEGPHTLQILSIYVDDRGKSRGHTGN